MSLAPPPSPHERFTDSHTPDYLMDYTYHAAQGEYDLSIPYDSLDRQHLGGHEAHDKDILVEDDECGGGDGHFPDSPGSGVSNDETEFSDSEMSIDWDDSGYESSAMSIDWDDESGDDGDYDDEDEYPTHINASNGGIKLWARPSTPPPSPIGVSSHTAFSAHSTHQCLLCIHAEPDGLGT